MASTGGCGLPISPPPPLPHRNILNTMPTVPENSASIHPVVSNQIVPGGHTLVTVMPGLPSSGQIQGSPVSAAVRPKSPNPRYVGGGREGEAEILYLKYTFELREKFHS